MQFTDQSTNTPTSWLWNFGDNSTSTNRNPSHTYTTAGTYSVSLTVTNSYGSNTKTVSNFITVNPAGSEPVANFTADITTINLGGSVQFTDQSINSPTSWLWNFGDGSPTSTSNNPSHSYTTAGTYTVSLTVTNTYGSNTKTINNYITVNQNENNIGIIFNPNLTYGTVIDLDGNVYYTIQIGTQTWMAENLKITKYNNGVPISEDTNGVSWLAQSTPLYCWYNNDAETYKSIYGALYNWYTISAGNPCPVDWHVPNNDEWNLLIEYFGGAIDAGGKLKETSSSHWENPNEAADNQSGFTALPGGNRVSDATGSYWDIGAIGIWWSSSETNSTHAGSYQMSSQSSSVFRGSQGKNEGLSIRCVKD